jgi:hypothetical protein
MSTLRTNRIELSDGSQGVDTGYVIGGSVKSHVRLYMVGSVIYSDSLNVSSGTDNGVGDWTINLSNAMATSTYSGVTGGNQSGGGSHSASKICLTSFAATNFRIMCEDGSNNAADMDIACAATLGDLA